MADRWRRKGGLPAPSFLLPFLLLLPLLPACGGRGATILSSHTPAADSATLRLEIASSRIEANDAFVEVRFRLSGAQPPDPDSAVTYLLDEATGERFYSVKLQRAGKIGGNGSEDGDAHSVLFKNRDGILRPGSRAVLVVGTLRKELVLRER